MRNLLFALVFLLSYGVLNLPAGEDVIPTERIRLRGQTGVSSLIKKMPLLKDSVDSMWDDLDLSSTVSCGSHRCFVPSVSDAGVGYIMARVEKDTLSGMVEATEMASAMEREYGAKSFYIPGEAPVDASLPDGTRAKLNEKVRNPLREHQFPTSVGKDGTIERFYEEPSVVVQRMKRADPSSLLAHCADNGFSLGQLPKFLSAVTARYRDDDLGEFKANLARDRYRMHNLLIGMPELSTDLQVLVSPEGELYFIDFGGHGAWTAKDERILTVRPKEELCGESFDMILDALNNYDAFTREEWKWNSRKYHRHHSYGFDQS